MLEASVVTFFTISFLISAFFLCNLGLRNVGSVGSRQLRIHAKSKGDAASNRQRNSRLQGLSAQNYFGKKELKALSDRSAFYFANDSNAPIILELVSEVLRQRSSSFFGSTSGIYIRNASQLEQRFALARRVHNRDCQRNHTLLFICVITKLDGRDLQEWMTWQILILGVHHIVVYLNSPDDDNSLTAIAPFVKAGYVTPFNMTGSGRQKDAYPHCVDLIRKKACNYTGRGNLAKTPDCSGSTDIDTYLGRDRPVWVAGFDSDEFAYDSHGACIVDVLQNYSGANGLMLPWLSFGHSGVFLTPENELVTELYTRRMPLAGDMGKAFNRVYHIRKMTNSHVAKFKDGKLAVDEFYNLVDYADVHGYNYSMFKEGLVHPRLRLNHYLTKSVEHLVKKWVRGVADFRDWWGKAAPRELAQVKYWLSSFVTDWVTEDLAAQPMAKVVHTALFGSGHR